MREERGRKPSAEGAQEGGSRMGQRGVRTGAPLLHRHRELAYPPPLATPSPGPPRCWPPLLLSSSPCHPLLIVAVGTDQQVGRLDAHFGEGFCVKRWDWRVGDPPAGSSLSRVR